MRVEIVHRVAVFDSDGARIPLRPRTAKVLAVLMLRPKVIQVVSDGDLLKVRLKPFESRQMGAAGTVRRGLVGVTVTPADHHTLSIRA